jgi:hypothetical protein
MRHIKLYEQFVNEAAEENCLMVEIDADYQNDRGRDIFKTFKVLVTCKDTEEAKKYYDVLSNTANIDTEEIAEDIVNDMINSSVMIDCNVSKKKAAKLTLTLSDFLNMLEDKNKDLVKKLRSL